MLWTALLGLLSHWRRHPVQLVTLVVGLALATGLWTGVQAINAEARASYARASATLDQDSLQRVVGDGRTLGWEDFAALRRAGWAVSPVLDARLPGTGLRLLGIDPFTAPPGGALPDLSETGDLERFLSGDLVFAAPGTMDRLPEGLPEARPVDGLAPGTVLADLAAAQALARTEEITRFLLLGREGEVTVGEVIADIRIEAPDASTDIGRLTGSFHLNLTAFGLLSFAVGLFIVQSAVGLAFEQRRPLFRTLRALGVPACALVGLLAAELTLMTLLAGALGVALGYVVAAALLPGVAATLGGLYGAGVSGTLTLAPEWWLTGFAMAGAGLALAGGQGLWQVARLPALAPAMPRAWARVRVRALRRQALGGVGLLALGVAAVLLADGLVAGFVLLACLLLGAALLLPPLLVLVLDAGSALARGPVAQWLWADARQQVPGLSLALMALLLALAANIGVGTMVGSFRETFTGWLDQRLPAELYLSAGDEAQADAVLEAIAGRAEALPTVSIDTRLQGVPGVLYGISDHPTWRENWPMLDASRDVWDRLAAGEGALVNEQLARRDSLAVGDVADLGAGGERVVLGIYSDYGNPLGQAMIGTDSFTTLFPDIRPLSFALRVPPEDAGRLAEELRERFDLRPQQLVDQASVKEFSLRVFENTFAVTGALNVLTLGVAGFALWAGLTTLATMRLPQLAPVWALGLTRGRLALADLVRALLLASFTALLAVPVGIVLAWALLAVVNVEAFGWKLPMRLDPVEWLVLGAFALLAAGLAAAGPAWRLWRLPPARLVQVFANER
jgi:putative ABC transport system permease protein